MSSYFDDAPDVAEWLGTTEAADQLIDDLRDAGCRLIAKGLPILPLNGKSPCNGAGNQARAWQRVKCDAARLYRGLDGARFPKRNHGTGKTPESAPGIGLRMGPDSCVDIETDSNDERAAVSHLFRGCRQPVTVSYTSSRGQHDLYAWDSRFLEIGQGVFKYATPDGKSVSIRLGASATGAQSVIPPTPGREWLAGRSFDELDPVALPEIVIQRLLEQARASSSRVKPKLRNADPATRPKNDKHSPVKSHKHRTARALPSDRFVLRDTYESVPCALVDQLHETIVDKAIKLAVDQCVVTQFRERHTQVFRLVRQLRAIPQLSPITRRWLESSEGQEWWLPILLEWFQRSKPFMNADFGECWEDFVEGWEKVKHPWGSALALRHADSLAEQIPAEVIQRLGYFDGEKIRQLIRLLIVLQRATGTNSFPLDGRACSAVMGPGFSQKSVSRQLLQLQKLGILSRAAAGRRGRAALYQYLPAFENRNVRKTQKAA